jgi:hypothetical protein
MPRRAGANRRVSVARRVRRVHSRVRRHVPAAARTLALVLVVGIAAGACLAAARAGSAWLHTTQRLAVKAIEVAGCQRATDDEVVKAAGLVAGMSLADIQPSRVKEALARSMPWVERVRVQRWWPGKVVVRVTERTPIALVNLGKVYQMDASGVLFEAPAGAYLDLPVVSGLADTLVKGEPRRLRPSALERFHAFRRDVMGADPQWLRHITQIDFSRHESVRLALEGYPAVVEVSCTDVTRSMENLRRLLDVLPGGEEPPRGINLCYPNMAYVAP